MKTCKTMKTVLAASIILVTNNVYATPSMDSLIGQQYDASAVQKTLSGKNFVVETNANNKIVNVIATGNVGDGQDALTVTEYKSKPTTSKHVELPANVSGQDAINYYGDRIDKVANVKGFTTERLKEELLSDPSIRVDTRNGNLFVVEEPMEKGLTATGVTLPIAQPAPAMTDVFKLHSKPGSTKVIYIDFDGHVVSGSAWSGGTITAPAYDLSNNPAVFDDNERNNIYSIWQRVAEDYAPFDIDVTTADPGDAALTRSSATDMNYGTRAVVTKAGTVGCGGCGGVAYVGVINQYSTSNYQPAWVFQNSLANNEKYIAEAVSHEVGHTLGLLHDGDAKGPYYRGHGGTATTSTSWGSIMGAGYYVNLTQFSKGEYPDANSKQDDFATILSKGISYRTDDYGNTIQTSTTIETNAVSGVQQGKAFGLIETATDVDMFAFNTETGSVYFQVVPIGKGSNVDLQLTLYDAKGTVVMTGNDALGLAASVNKSLPAGTYYLGVAGAGKVATATDPGYTTYGNVGQYYLSGSYAALIPKRAPTVNMTSSVTTGNAPLTVNFASNGTLGNNVIKSYAWEFEAGKTSNVPNPAYTFAKVGTYLVAFTVTNENGLSTTKTTTINVTASPAKPSTHVRTINVDLPSTTKVQARALVTIVDKGNFPVPNATVRGTWSGMLTGNGSAVTDKTGVATFMSKELPISTKGSATFTVTGVTAAVGVYDSTLNLTSRKIVTAAAKQMVYNSKANVVTRKTITR